MTEAGDTTDTTESPDNSDPFAQMLAKAKPRTKTVKILLDQDLAGEHEALEGTLEALTTASAADVDTDKAEEIAQRIVDVEAEMEARTQTFRLQSIGHKRWRDLLAKYPPTNAQKEAFGRSLDHNPEKFPQSAIVESCVDPKLTVEQVKKLEEVFNEDQWEQLWGGCKEVNLLGDIPKSLLAGGILQASAGSKNSARRKASRGRSS